MISIKGGKKEGKVKHISMDKELRVEFDEIVKQVRSELNEDLDESFEGESILKCGQ